MRKEARTLHAKAVDSLVLAVDHFNRTSDRGRTDAVLIFMDRAFELLMKAIIIHRGGRIRAKKSDPRTISFDECLRRCLSSREVKCLDENDAVSLQTLNSLRDAAQHYLIELSEEQLYVHAQAGVSLFARLSKDVMSRKLYDEIPRRILPVCEKPPRDLGQVFDADFASVKSMVADGTRKRLDASARLRSMAVLQNSLDGKKTQPTDAELEKVIERVRGGEDWRAIFPGVATLRIDSDAEGPGIALRITNREGEAVKLVKDGDPDATVVAVKKVDNLEFYKFGLTELATKLGNVSTTKLLHLIREDRLQGQEDMFRAIKIKSQTYKLYSHKCLDYLRKRLTEVDLDELWAARRCRESSSSDGARPAHSSQVRKTLKIGAGRGD